MKSNAPYWSEKVAGNRARDERHRAVLERDGWTVIVVWECELRDHERLAGLAERIKALPSGKKPLGATG